MIENFDILRPMVRPESAGSRPWVLLAFAAAILVLDPLRDFPLDDDWVCYLSVRRWLMQGELRINDLSSPTLVAHILWGALFSRLFGLSHEVLRVSTLCLSLLALAAMRSLVRERPQGPWLLSPGFALMTNPLFFLLSLTFMTDIPYLAWSLLALAVFARAARTDRAAWWLAGAGLASLAYLVRQIGILIPVGVATSLFLDSRLTRRRLGLILCPPLLVLAAHQSWFHWVHGPTWAYEVYVRGATAARLTDLPGLLAATYLRLAAAFLYVGLFTLPWIAALNAAEGLKLPKPASALAVLLTLLPLILKVNAFPFFSGVIGEAGLGNPTVADFQFKAADLIGSPYFFGILTAAAVFSLLGWSARLDELSAAWRDKAVAALAWPCLLQFGAVLLSPRFKDRYLLALLPLVLAWASRAAGPALEKAPMPRRLPGAAVSLLFLAWSLAGTRDYLNWNQAKWEAGRAAYRLGLKPEEVDNGWDWSGLLVFEPRMSRLRAEKPLAAIGEWDWINQSRFRAKTSFSPYAGDGRAPLLEVSYRTPLSRTPGRVYLYATR